MQKQLHNVRSAIITVAPWVAFCGLILIAFAIAVPVLHLGIKEQFVLYKYFSLTRSDIGYVGVIVFLMGAVSLSATRMSRGLWRNAADPFKKILQSDACSNAIAVAFCVGAIFLALKLFDILYPFPAGPNGGIGGLPGHDLSQAELSARALELFPYEGWHMQANVHSGDFRLGSMGFAIDFDLLNPPPKNANEFRIILIGGSGAQGWGASSTEHTMARLLEKRLNRSEDGRRYRVINMAMGSSMTYQNFISLNRWGHALEPDLILSYSGVNDYAIPVHEEGLLDAPYQFKQLSALALAARGSEMPPELKWLHGFLPNLMTKTRVGYALKVALYPEFFEQRAIDSYHFSRGATDKDPNVFMDKVVTPLYIHALSSIRRDFCGIPVMVVFQAMQPSTHQSHLDTMPGLAPDFYERMQQQTMKQLSDDGWYFANFYAFAVAHPDSSIAVHLSDAGQEILTDFVYRHLRPLLASWGRPLVTTSDETCRMRTD